jgi:hypothetical protein
LTGLDGGGNGDEGSSPAVVVVMVEPAQRGIALSTVDQRREARRHRGTPHGSAEVVYERGDACSRRLVITAPRRRLSVQLVDGIGDERDSVGQSR